MRTQRSGIGVAEGREGQGIGKSGDWKRKDRKRECGRMYKGGTGIGICKAGNYTSSWTETISWGRVCE